MLRTALKDLELLFLFMPFVAAVVTVSPFSGRQSPGAAPWGHSSCSSRQCLGGMGHSVWSPRPGGLPGGKPWFGLEPSPCLCLSVHGTGAGGRVKAGNLNFVISMARSLSRLCALPASCLPLLALGAEWGKREKNLEDEQGLLSNSQNSAVFSCWFSHKSSTTPGSPARSTINSIPARLSGIIS